MNLNGMSLRKALAFFAIAIFLLVAAYVFLAGTGKVPWPSSRFTETKMKIANLSGGDFEVDYTNSDLLAKEEFISVYVSKAEANTGSLLSKWFPRKTLLLRYDPGNADAPLPSISASGPNRISVSIPRVSSIIFQSRTWGQVSIDYEIEHVDYPSKEAP